MLSVQYLDSIYRILEQKLRITEEYGLREASEENWHRHRGDFEQWRVLVEEREARDNQRRHERERQEREFYAVLGEGAHYTEERYYRIFHPEDFYDVEDFCDDYRQECLGNPPRLDSLRGQGVWDDSEYDDHHHFIASESHGESGCVLGGEVDLDPP
jgi:hypothetical protein